MIRTKFRSAFFYSGAFVIAALFCAVHIKLSEPIIILLSVLILLFGYAAAVCDINNKRIPNKLILIMLGSWFVSVLPGLFLNTDATLPLIKDSLLGFLFGGGIFLSIYLLSKKGLGGGDVKFMAVCGLYLGINRSISTILFGTFLSAIVGLSLILLKKLGRKDPIPLAPFLYIGILIALFLL